MAQCVSLLHVFHYEAFSNLRPVETLLLLICQTLHHVLDLVTQLYNRMAHKHLFAELKRLVFLEVHL